MESELEQLIASIQALNRQMRWAAFDQDRQPITRVQWLVMRQLHRRGGMTIGQLAEHLDVRASTMSQMLDRLEKLGCIIREQDEQDARVKIIRLAPDGAGMIVKTESIWKDSLAEPFGQLDAEERKALTALMKKLAAQLPGRGEV